MVKEIRIYLDGSVTKEILEEEITALCRGCDSAKKGPCINPNVGPDEQAVNAATIKAGAKWCGWATENDGKRPKDIFYRVRCPGFIPPQIESEAQPQKAPDIK
jgi:hypothetical protein